MEPIRLARFDLYQFKAFIFVFTVTLNWNIVFHALIIKLYCITSYSFCMYLLVKSTYILIGAVSKKCILALPTYIYYSLSLIITIKAIYIIKQYSLILYSPLAAILLISFSSTWAEPLHYVTIIINNEFRIPFFLSSLQLELNRKSFINTS